MNAGVRTMKYRFRSLVNLQGGPGQKNDSLCIKTYKCAKARRDSFIFPLTPVVLSLLDNTFKQCGLT